MLWNVKSLFLLAIIIASLGSWDPVVAQVNGSESLASTKNTTQQDTISAPAPDKLLAQRSNLTYPSVTNHIVLHEKHLQVTSIPYGIAQVANRSLVSEVCLKDLRNFKQNILHKKTWAMKAQDASGTKQAGFMFQNNFWLGSSQVCATANKPPHITLSKLIKRSMHSDLLDDVAPFDLAYYIVYIKHNSPWQLELVSNIEPILHLGLCLPASCTANEIQSLMQELIQQKLLFDTELYDIRSEVLYVKNLKLKDAFFQRTSLKILTALFIFTSVMMLSATYLNAKNSRKTSQKLFASSDADNKSVNGENSTGKDKVDIANGITYTMKSYMECFDTSANWQKLFATKPCISNDIPVINGLRTVSAFSILFIHALFFMLHKVQNIPFLLSVMELDSLQLGNLPMYLVDGFFTISGFLQTYNFLKNTKQMEEIRRNTLMQNLRPFFKLLFHRYLRLAPLYFVIMAASDLLSAYINDVSVFHIFERYDEVCARTWWHNVLFIQSFFGHKDLCLNWSWSLSCEMQYFIVATILLFTYVKHPKFAKNSVLVLLASNIVWSLFIGTSVKYQFAFESFYHSVDYIYFSSLVRVMPYIMGSIAAWYLIERQGVLNITPAVEKLLWNVTMLLFATSGYTAYWRDLNYFTSISLFMLGHFMVSLATCWCIIGSATGRSTRLTRILEAPLLQHVNRLTYAIYMLNPFITTLFVSFDESSTHVNATLSVIHCLGIAVLVYLASIVFSLSFEMPYCNWSSLMLRRNKAKTA